MPGVQLEDDDGGGFADLRQRTAKHAMVKAGIAKTTAQANVLLFVVVILLVSGVVYFMRTAIPPAPPELGDDVPRRGEVIPLNRTL